MLGNLGSNPVRPSIPRPGPFPINFLWMGGTAMQTQIAYELLLGSRSGYFDNAR